MQKTGDNQVRAAKMLGITRATLRKRLDRNAAAGPEEEEE
jgi:DNA-binding protein Fis